MTVIRAATTLLLPNAAPWTPVESSDTSVPPNATPGLNVSKAWPASRWWKASSSPTASRRWASTWVTTERLAAVKARSSVASMAVGYRRVVAAAMPRSIPPKMTKWSGYKAYQ